MTNAPWTPADLLGPRDQIEYYSDFAAQRRAKPGEIVAVTLGPGGCFNDFTGQTTLSDDGQTLIYHPERPMQFVAFPGTHSAS